MIGIPDPRSALRLLRRQPQASPRPLPLRDPAPEPGLFGPGSVTWVVMREPRLLLAAGRALLMQAANPLVAQGAIEHSTYKSDPYGRLERTVRWVTIVCFGTTREAERVSGRVSALHRPVSGNLPEVNATSRVGAGTPYSASDPALLRWVHASFVDTMLVAHDALVGGLSAAQRDAFVREWDAVARLMGLSRTQCWPDNASLQRYVEQEVRRGQALPGAGSREVAETVLHPPVRSRLMRLGMETLAFIASGLLPSELRRGYGIIWTPAHAAAFAALTRSLRLATTALPRRLRISPVYDLALARSEGRWPDARAA
ncbi:MAG TPA: oxygenase MpaB family protein [Candidatus Saccharimonadales bacterium]|nr:oxygenase MpaB family protein [Candidatus Saccharimonadales bacterium]